VSNEIGPQTCTVNTADMELGPVLLASS